MSDTSSPQDTPRSQKRASEAAAIKLLPKLVEAFVWNNPQRMAEVSSAVASSIDTHHPAIAKKIRDTLSRNLRPVHARAIPDGLISYEEARHGFSNVVLPEYLEAECAAIVQEHSKHDQLKAFGLDPRHKVLLHGEPGNGKTLLAEAFAYEIGVPFLRVKYGGLVDSYMGGTSKNIDSIMEYVKNGPCLLFLDEFDGIGIDRNAKGDVGEMRRVTNQMLIALDRLPSTCVFVAATNCLDLVDSALKRRFDFIFEIPKPSVDLMARCASKELSPALTPGHNVSNLAVKVADLGLKNLSEVVNLCKRIRRDIVLNDGNGISRLISSEELPRY